MLVILEKCIIWATQNKNSMLSGMVLIAELLYNYRLLKPSTDQSASKENFSKEKQD
jgi:hypothetical protein